MMDSIRSAASGWVAKVLIGLLVLSFAIWGVNDVFFGFRSEVLGLGGRPRDFGRGVPAAVSISSCARYRASRARRLTAEDARQMGLDRADPRRNAARCRARGTGEACLKLAVPREAVALDIAGNEAFQNTRGEFDPELFRRLLAENGIDEQAFPAGETSARAAARHRRNNHRGVRGARQRSWKPSSGKATRSATPDISSSPATNPKSPRPAASELAGILRQEPAAASPPPPTAPSSFSSCGHATWRAKMTVTDDDLRAAYEKRKAEYHTPETPRRSSRSLSRPSRKHRQAKERIAAGADFLAVAKERGLSEKDALARQGPPRPTSPTRRWRPQPSPWPKERSAIRCRARLSVALLRVTQDHTWRRPGHSSKCATIFWPGSSSKRPQEEIADPARQGRGRARRRGKPSRTSARRSGSAVRNIPMIDAARPRCRRQGRRRHPGQGGSPEAGLRQRRRRRNGSRVDGRRRASCGWKSATPSHLGVKPLERGRRTKSRPPSRRKSCATKLLERARDIARKGDGRRHHRRSRQGGGRDRAKRSMASSATSLPTSSTAWPFRPCSRCPTTAWPLLRRRRQRCEDHAGPAGR